MAPSPRRPLATARAGKGRPSPWLRVCCSGAASYSMSHFAGLPQTHCEKLHQYLRLSFFKHFGFMASGELSVLGSSFRGKRGIKNFKVEFSPATSSLEETLSKSYRISPAREKICHENPSGLADLCRGGDFCQQWLLSGGKRTLLLEV